MYLNPISFSVSLTLLSSTRVFYCSLILSCVSYPTYYLRYTHSSASIVVSFLKSFAKRSVSSITNRLRSDPCSLFKWPRLTTSFRTFYKSFLLSSKSFSKFSRIDYVFQGYIPNKMYVYQFKWKKRKKSKCILAFQ